VSSARTRIAAAAYEQRAARSALWRARIVFLPLLLGWVVAPAGCAGFGVSERDWSTAIVWAITAACGLAVLAVIVRISRRRDRVIEGLASDLDITRGPVERANRDCSHCGAPLEAASSDATARCAHCGAENALDASRVAGAYAPRMKAAAWVSLFVRDRARADAEGIKSSAWLVPLVWFAVPLPFAFGVRILLDEVSLVSSGDRTYPLITLEDGRRCISSSTTPIADNGYIEFYPYPPKGLNVHERATIARKVESIASVTLRDRNVTHSLASGKVLRVERTLADLKRELLVVSTSSGEKSVDVAGSCLDD
jgi:hypothetical protein